MVDEIEAQLLTLVSYPKKPGVPSVRLSNDILVSLYRGRGGPEVSIRFPSGKQIARVLSDAQASFSGASQWRSEQTLRLSTEFARSLAEHIVRLAQDPRSGVK